MRASYDGKHEIKRSLGTKDPKLAHLYAHAISLKLLNGYPIKTLLDNLNQFIENIKADNLSIYGDTRGWVAHLPNGVRIEVDPNNRVDHEAGKELVNGFPAQGATVTQLGDFDNEHSQTKLKDKVAAWIEKLHAEKLRRKTIDEYEKKLELLIEFTNNIVIAKFTAEQFSQYVNELASGKITGRPLAHSTVNKYIAAANSYFKYCQLINVWPKSKSLPTEGLSLGKNKKVIPNSHKPFSSDDLKKIFVNNPELMPHQYWVPLIALYTGARIEELCQLSLDDIYQDNKQVWVLSINEDNSNLNAGLKKIKTAAAERTIPLHTELLKHGLLNYVKTIRQHFSNETMLFPYLVETKYDKFSESASKWFSRYIKRMGVTSNRKSFHSFRSTFNNWIKENSIEEEVRCQLEGHEHNTVNSKNYSNKHQNKWLLDNVIKKIAYEDLDLSQYTYDQSLLKSQLQTLIDKKNSKLKNRQALVNKDN